MKKILIGVIIILIAVAAYFIGKTYYLPVSQNTVSIITTGVIVETGAISTGTATTGNLESKPVHVRTVTSKDFIVTGESASGATYCYITNAENCFGMRYYPGTRNDYRKTYTQQNDYPPNTPYTSTDSVAYTTKNGLTWNSVMGAHDSAFWYYQGSGYILIVNDYLDAKGGQTVGINILMDAIAIR